MAVYPENLDTVNDAAELLRLTLEHFGAETGTIHVLEADGMLHLRALAGALPPTVVEAIQVIPVGKGIAGQAVEQRKPVNLCNLQADAGPAPPEARKTGVQGSICVPMMVGERAVGALGIATYRERTFTDPEVALLLDGGAAIGKKLWNS